MKRLSVAMVSLLAVGTLAGGHTPAHATPAAVPAVPTAAPTAKPGDLGKLPVPPHFDAAKSKPVPVPDLNGKLDAHGKPIRPPATLATGYKYAGQNRAQTGVIATSTDSWIDKPSLDTIDAHSVAETAAKGADGRSFIEIGWVTNNNGLFGSNNLNPHLFGSGWWNDGTKQVWCGSYVGGCGYVDYAGNATDLGADLIGVRFTMKQFQIQFDSVASRWWLRYDGNWIGSFPSNMGHPVQSPAFTSVSLVQNFGEVAYEHYPTCTDMGAGWMAVAGGTPPTSGAEFTSLNTATSSVGYSLVDYNQNVQTDPTKYGLVDKGVGGFKYGGPGSSPNPGACPTP